jgi:hypothetical protein
MRRERGTAAGAMPSAPAVYESVRGHRIFARRSGGVRAVSTANVGPFSSGGKSDMDERAERVAGFISLVANGVSCR